MNTQTTLKAALLGTAVLTSGAASAGLVGHWTFDSDTTDTTGSFDGAAQGDAAIDNATFQIGGGSLTVDGAGDYVDMGDIDINTGGYTLMAWVNFDGVASGSDYIAGKEQSFHLGIRSGNRIWGSVSTTNNPFTATGNDGQVLDPSGGWYHIAMVYDGANLFRYINGVEDGTDTDPPMTGNVSTQSGTDRDFWVGSSANSNRDFDGFIDDVALFDEGLSGADLLAIYNGGLAGQNVAQVIPEPGSLALLSLGGLLVLRRRR